jgi:hypothetical protein
MPARFMFRWFLMTALLILVALAWCVFSTSPVAAQCGTPKSSCISCHGQGNHVTGMGNWNSVHVNQDMCIDCHGGNGNTMNNDLAHEGIVAQPLSDIYTDCHNCHPSDYIARSAEFAATLSVTPSSCATPTAIALNNVSGESPPSNIIIPSKIASATIHPQSIVLILGWTVILTFFVLGIGWLSRLPTNGGI